MDEQNMPAAPATTEPTPVAPTQSVSEDPGKTLAIVGIVFSIIFALVGLVICIIARNKSKKAGFKNNLATVGIVLAVINMILGVIITTSR